MISLNSKPVLLLLEVLLVLLEERTLLVVIVTVGIVFDFSEDLASLLLQVLELVHLYLVLVHQLHQIQRKAVTHWNFKIELPRLDLF